MIAAFFVNFFSSEAVHRPKSILKEVFSDLDPWKGIGDTQIEAFTVEALNLDDHLFRTYRNGHHKAVLYIGYYRTTEKIGEAHSPLVCFPGQGWEISIPENLTLQTDAGEINLVKLIANKGNHRELLLYWFQSYDKTTGSTFWQKILNLRSKLYSHPEDNAFVRISLPIQADNFDDVYLEAINFIQVFYPQFFSYMTF